MLVYDIYLHQPLLPRHAPDHGRDFSRLPFQSLCSGDAAAHRGLAIRIPRLRHDRSNRPQPRCYQCSAGRRRSGWRTTRLTTESVTDALARGEHRQCHARVDCSCSSAFATSVGTLKAKMWSLLDAYGLRGQSCETPPRLWHKPRGMQRCPILGFGSS